MKIKEKLKEGCRKELDCVINGEGEVIEIIKCGSVDKTMKEIYLCYNCKTKLQAIKEYEKEILEMINDLENPYPEDIFLPVSKEEYTAIHNLLLKNYNIPLDRVSADLMRIARKIMKEELKSKIKEVGK